MPSHGQARDARREGIGQVIIHLLSAAGLAPPAIGWLAHYSSVVRGGVKLTLILASMLHGIATGNLLPADVTTVCVDIEPAVVTKLSDRGTFQSISVVADAGSFLRELVQALSAWEPDS